MRLLLLVGPLLAAAAASSGDDQGGVTGWLLHVNGPLAYAVIGFLAFAEAGLMVGFFIPGETAVVVGGVLAGLGRVDLEVMMAVVVVCAIVGDSVGFELGKRAGPRLMARRPLRGNSAVRQTMGLLEHYGGPAVFLGRFLAFARALVPGLAGMSGLRYRTFLIYNAVGGVIWGVGYTLLGYVVGLSFQRVLKEVGLWSFAVVGAVVIVFVAIYLLRRRREHRRLALDESGGDEPASTTGDGDGAARRDHEEVPGPGEGGGTSDPPPPAG